VYSEGGTAETGIEEMSSRRRKAASIEVKVKT